MLSQRWYFKYVPVEQKRKFLDDRFDLPGLRYMATDYTAFESHFDKEMLESVEFQLYEYMTSQLPTGKEFMQDMRIQLRTNTCKFGNVTAKVKATRMSGEMTTSLGNSFTNLMVYLFLHRDDPGADCVIEGDDCLGCYTKRLPTKEDYEKLGLTVKIVPVPDYREASFCGQVYSSKSLGTLVDFHKVMTKTSWSSRPYMLSSEKTHKELLRAKAMSISYMHTDCPIVWAYAKWILKCTMGMRYRLERTLNSYQKAFVKKCALQNTKPQAPTMEVRVEYERIFGVSVLEQLSLEEWLLKQTKLKQVDHPVLIDKMTSCQLDYHCRFMITSQRDADFVMAGSQKLKEHGS